LIGTTDSRLRTITLVGDSQLVSVAENYLRQIDLRQRQVALSVKLIDVSLKNNTSISNSFEFSSGSTLIVSDQGALSASFGGDVNYGATKFFDSLQAQIESESAKVIASPTLIIGENSDLIDGGDSVAAVDVEGAGQAASIGRRSGNESFVSVGSQVITSYDVTAGQNGAGNSCQPQFGTAGLTFGAKVSRIDDNGFVTFSISPEVSAVVSREEIAGCGSIDILSRRRLDTGWVRVRDGQTLVLTGVISDADIQAVSKWPILGDIPLIGQFFRSSEGVREKQELVILVTPRMVRDDVQGAYGYGYYPSTNEVKRSILGKGA